MARFPRVHRNPPPATPLGTGAQTHPYPRRAHDRLFAHRRGYPRYPRSRRAQARTDGRLRPLRNPSRRYFGNPPAPARPFGRFQTGAGIGRFARGRRLPEKLIGRRGREEKTHHQRDAGRCQAIWRPAPHTGGRSRTRRAHPHHGRRASNAHPVAPGLDSQPGRARAGFVGHRV